MPVQPTIFAGVFTKIAPTIDAAGLDFHGLAEQVDLLPEELADPERQISLNSVCEFLELAARAARSDAFALELAKHYPAGSTGVLGYAMLTAPTLRQCLQDVERYSALITPEQSVMFEDDGAISALSWYFPEGLHRPYSQYISLSASLLVRRIRLAAGENWQPEMTTFEFPEPTDVEPYRLVFGMNIVFDASLNRLEFRGEILDLPMPQSDAKLHGLLRELGDYRLSELEAISDIVDRTQDQIIALLNHGPVTLEMVARDLGLSARSLQRRLKEEGTSFQVVLEKTRRLLARHYLRASQHTLSEVAFLLGFSEQSAFSRACKRWFDATPYEMRAKLCVGL